MPGGDSTVISRIDGVMTSVAVKAPVAAVATTPIQLKGLQTVNGVALAATIPPTRCLVTAQADSTTNGIYDVSTTGWQRSTDFDGAYDAVQGTLVVVNGDGTSPVAWQLATPNPVLFGTSAIEFVSVGSVFPGLGSLVIALSNPLFAGNFTGAVAAAALIGAAVLVDRAGFLTGATSISASVASIISTGAAPITLGNYDITFAGNPLSGPARPIFSFTGTGRVKGAFDAPYLLPEWFGIIGVEATVGNPFTASAPYAAANKTVLQYIENYASQSNYVVRVLFTKYMTAMNGGITNPIHGLCAEWHGINQMATRVYAPDGNNIRDLWGKSAASIRGIVCYTDLGMFCAAINSGVSVNIYNACEWVLARRCYFSLSQRAIQVSDQADSIDASTGFAEDCVIEDCFWDYDCGIPIYHVNAAGGTGSRRGFVFRGKNNWTPSSSAAGSSDTFCQIATSVNPYNWGASSVTITPSGPGRNIYVIGNSSGQICNMAGLALNLEFDDATYFVVLANPSGGLVCSAGGPPMLSGASFKYGKFVWHAGVQAIGTSRYLMFGEFILEQQGALTLTGSVTAADLRMITGGSSAFEANLLFRSSTPGNFTARAVITGMPDSGDGFTGGADGFVKILANASSITFDKTAFSVGSDGLLKVTANFGGNTVKVTGSIRLGGIT